MTRMMKATVFVLLVAGCSGLQDFGSESNVVSTSDVAEKGDDALTCDQISTQVAAMNDTITKTQRMTSEEVNHRTRLDATIQSMSDQRISNQVTTGRSGYPAVGWSSNVPTNGASLKDNELLVSQGKTARTAIARANYLVVLGKKKHCFREVASS